MSDWNSTPVTVKKLFKKNCVLWSLKVGTYSKNMDQPKIDKYNRNQAKAIS